MLRFFTVSRLLFGLLALGAITNNPFGDPAVSQQTKSNSSNAQRNKYNPGTNPKAKPARKPSSRKSVKPGSVKIPKPETLLALIRLHLVALDHAIKAEDFGVLHAISAPGLQSKLTTKRLAAAFAPLRKRRIDLAAVVIATPQITESPRMLSGNVLNIVGYFPSGSQRVDFHMQFQPADRQWKLLGMNVSAKPLNPAKPKSTAPTPSTAKKKRKKD